MQPPSYQELRVGLIINSDLTETAKMAMQAELDERARTENLYNYVLVKKKETAYERDNRRQFEGITMWLFMSLLAPLSFYAVLPWWKKFLNWLTG
jgi:hypothetical protein